MTPEQQVVDSTPIPEWEWDKIKDPSGKELCDGCPQPATWRLTHITQRELMFCGHHAQVSGILPPGEDFHHAYVFNENHRSKGSDH